MARLRRQSDGLEQILVGDTLVGRAPGAVLRLSGRQFSGHHASVQWSGQRWEVRDLGSRNGTFVQGGRLEPGQPRALGQDMVVDFGGEERWVLVDESPPGASARALDTGELVFPDGGHISLPSTEQPSVLIYQHPRLGWLVEGSDGAVDAATSGQVLVIDGRAWSLDLGAVEATRPAAPRARPLAGATLRLTVSPDEENVDVEIVWPDEARPIQASVHWYAVLLLARARLADELAGEVPPRERGWIHRDDLCDQLRTTVSKLNVDLHRVRGLLGRADVEDPSTLFERRSATGQIRLGTAAIEIL